MTTLCFQAEAWMLLYQMAGADEVAPPLPDEPVVPLGSGTTQS
ncbi:MAG TPA: hypothetical protein VJ577_06220 [Burkholderiaceae bacterium]|nr:hypothetical protein [Burkholderiaceae bacterium]